MAPEQNRQIFEDDDDWLCGYLATTKYSNDSRIMSNPVKQVKAKAAREPRAKKYSLQARPRRASGAAERTRSGPMVGELPGRVNRIREEEGDAAMREKQAGHFVREHKVGKSFRSGIRRSVDCRRQSIDFDELDAVKERLQQLTAAYYRGQVASKVPPHPCKA